MLFVTLCAVLLGLKGNRAIKQREAVAILHAAGANVVYDYQYTEDPKSVFGKVHANAKSVVPGWLLQLAGVDFFHNAVVVSFPYNGKASDENLRALRVLTDLREVYIDGAEVTDAGLAHLTNLRNLEHLAFEHTQITSAGLEQLKGLTNLNTRLYVGGAHIDDTGLQHLASLKDLEHLVLQYNRIEGEGLRHLTGLKNLKELRLNDNPLTDAAVPHLAQMKSLEELPLSGTLLSDEAIHYLLQALPNWERTAIWRPDEFSSPVRDLRYAKLQAELGLSEEQIEAIDEVHQRFLEESKKTPPPKRGWGSFVEVAFHPDRDVATAGEREVRRQLLTEEQQARMEQIDWQRASFRYGINVFLRPHVARSLQLTLAQQAALRRLADESLGKERELLRNGDARQSLRQRREAMHNAAKLLRSEQRARWDAMIGELFDVAVKWFFEAPEEETAKSR